jgi:hypothetical protein
VNTRQWTVLLTHHICSVPRERYSPCCRFIKETSKHVTLHCSLVWVAFQFSVGSPCSDSFSSNHPGVDTLGRVMQQCNVTPKAGRRIYQCFLNFHISSVLQRNNAFNIPPHILDWVGTAMGYRLGDRGSIAGRGKRFFSTPQRADRFWGPHSLLSNGYARGAPSPWVNRPGREANHSPPPSAEVKNGAALLVSPLPHTSSCQ